MSQRIPLPRCPQTCVLTQPRQCDPGQFAAPLCASVSSSGKRTHSRHFPSVQGALPWPSGLGVSCPVLCLPAPGPLEDQALITWGAQGCGAPDQSGAGRRAIREAS